MAECGALCVYHVYSRRFLVREKKIWAVEVAHCCVAAGAQVVGSVKNLRVSNDREKPHIEPETCIHESKRRMQYATRR